MDAVSFAGQLKELLELENVASLTEQQLAAVVAQAATDTLLAAAQGATVTDSFSREQAGTILAALQWNHNPLMQSAVRVK